MNPLLDNDQVSRVTDVFSITTQTFDAVRGNNRGMGLILESAHARCAAKFYADLADELEQYQPVLAGLARDAQKRINEILEET